MKHDYFLEVLRLADPLHQQTPLTFEYINLEVGKKVVNEEAHVLSEKHGLPEVRVV